tara:strand:+ start:53 stop:202 length:150 start_codon:yes stop_codon:yes gene_type:complete
MDYKIIGQYAFNEPEVIDFAKNRIQAIRLTYEYRMAFGNKWSIVFKRNR